MNRFEFGYLPFTFFTKNDRPITNPTTKIPEPSVSAIAPFEDQANTLALA